MQRTYGYCRISRKTQNIERQKRNIQQMYPDAVMVEEAYTGTKIQGRKNFEKLLSQVCCGDRIVFDSVSRMSRNATEGIQTYEKLFNAGVELVFLKEPHINTAVYREALENQIAVSVSTGDHATDTFMKSIIDALNKFQMDIAKKQIELAFEQAEKEVTDLHRRTSEGIETARREGKQIGAKAGVKLNIKKKLPMMEMIRKHSKDFGGALSDIECMKLTGLARNTYYKYKKELRDSSFELLTEQPKQ